jgi:TIR domain
VKVFISWSGGLSRELAEALRKWLPRALQSVKPYFTPSDIEKGAKWDDEISKELETTDICIIALTRENLRSQWIAFEAGAISRTVDKARICPVVFDIEPTDIQGPLARFQASRFTKTEIRNLLGTINAAAENCLGEVDLNATLEKWWPDLETEVISILKTAQSSHKATKVRTERELVEETLLIVRGIQQSIGQRLSIIAELPGSDTVPAFRPNRLAPARTVDIVFAPHDSSEREIVYESIKRLLPGSKSEPLGPDTMSVRFRATDSELVQIQKQLAAFAGVLEVDQR